MPNTLGCAIAALLMAGGGAATRQLETTVQDDALLLHRSPASVRATAQQIAGLGADRVRITASWSDLAPAIKSKVVPAAPFDPTDSSTYPSDGFKRLDTAVKAVTDAGMKPQLDVAFFAPRWAVSKRIKGTYDRQRYGVDPVKFGQFAKAVARRYSGSFPDPADHRRLLPAVRMFTTWNEPNEPSFLQPQWIKNSDGSYRPYSPHLYRAMHNAAYDAIKSVSPNDLVLVGGTSAKGSQVTGRGAVPPLVFLRTLTCSTATGAPLNVPECKDYQPLKADGYAHHPYSMDTAPGVSDPDPDDAPIANIDRLENTLDLLKTKKRLATALPMYLTEYGYETKPPDPYQRFTPFQQAEYLGQATWLAYKNPDVRMFAQFLLRDIDPADSGFKKTSPKYWRDYQSGLLYDDGTPKPAAQAFKLPFWAQLYASALGQPPVLLLFGGVRPGNGRQLVRIERQDISGLGQWIPVKTSMPDCTGAEAGFFTNPDGYFVHTTTFPGPGNYRLGWSTDNGTTWQYGATVPVDGSAPLPVSGPLDIP